MKSRNIGITLIELLISMAIIVVMTTVAIPSYQSLTAHNRIVSQTNQLVAAIRLARSEAIKRGTPVTICKRSNYQCDTSTDGWEKGVLVIADANGNGKKNAGDFVIYTSEPLTGNFSIQGDAGVSSRITFNRFGGAQGFSGTLTVCGDGSSPAHANAILISPTGRISLGEDGADADSIVENMGGDNISCS